MKLMNSLTHSCMHSLASLAILALSGKAVFMIRATGAKLRMLASDMDVMVGDNAGAERRPICFLDDEEHDLRSCSDLMEDMLGQQWCRRSRG